MWLDALNDDRMTRQYAWGLDLAGQRGEYGQGGQLNSLEGAGGIGGLLAVLDTAGTATSADDRTFAYFYDANGNVAQVMETTPGDSGHLSAKYEYHPYGQIVYAQQLYNPHAYNQPYTFSTKPFDGETGLGYWGYRYYNPKLGRWISRDPIGEEGGKNLYAYARNNPDRYFDPDGRINVGYVTPWDDLDHSPQCEAWTTTSVERDFTRAKISGTYYRQKLEHEYSLIDRVFGRSLQATYGEFAVDFKIKTTVTVNLVIVGPTQSGEYDDAEFVIDEFSTYRWPTVNQYAAGYDPVTIERSNIIGVPCVKEEICRRRCERTCCSRAGTRFVQQKTAESRQLVYGKVVADALLGIRCELGRYGESLLDRWGEVIASNPLRPLSCDTNTAPSCGK